MSAANCPGCGQPVPAGQHFCSNCGAHLFSAETTQAASGGPETLQPVQTQAAYQPAQPVQTQSAYQPTQPVAWPPAGQPVPPARTTGLTPGQIKLFAGMGIAALLLAALTAFFWPSSQGDLIADASIGPAGGTIPMADGGKIEVPEGAVNKAEQVVVRKTVIHKRVTIGGVAYNPGDLPIWWFGPNLNFLRPVVIILPLSPNAVAARIFVIDNGRIRLITVVANRGGFVRVSVIGFRNGVLVVQA